jgi:hypothetical protein
MQIYVTVETYQGVVEDVCVFKTEGQAKRKEKNWLRSLNVQDDKKREELSFRCTEFQIHKCKLK